MEGEVSVRVKPTRIEDASPRALEINGYSEEGWRDALPLAAGLAQVSPLLDGATFAGHNVSFDRAFLRVAYARTRQACPAALIGARKVDTMALAWLLPDPSRSLDAACRALGIHRPTPHRALDDALASLRGGADDPRRVLGPADAGGGGRPGGEAAAMNAIVDAELAPSPYAPILAILARAEAARPRCGPPCGCSALPEQRRRWPPRRRVRLPDRAGRPCLPVGRRPLRRPGLRCLDADGRWRRLLRPGRGPAGQVRGRDADPT
ncbi:MAG: 3'-5' exonuclease [bacterium]